MASQFTGVYPTDQKEENFIEFSKNIRNKKASHPFIIANTDIARKSGTHWWSFLDTDEKDTLFLFDSLGTLGLLSFIVEDDLDIFNKLIPGQFKQIFPKDYEITLLKWKFSMEKYKKLKDKEINKLSDTTKHFYKFLYKFGKYKGVKKHFHVATVDDNVQSIDRY